MSNELINKIDKMSLNDTKQNLGQFYTTNYDHILKNMFIPDNVKNIIEPFAGKGDLFKFINKHKQYNIESYDIEPKHSNIIKRDTLNNPPNYNDKFIVTNPPYLARNKSKDKKIFDKYKQNDLYKCLIDELIKTKCLGGILIVPLNFWCSIRKADIELRKRFLNEYNLLIINIFEEKVFDDTSYAICSFQFEKLNNNTNTKCYIYPSDKKLSFILNEQNNYTIGGEIYKLTQDKKIKIERITKNNKTNDNKTNILVKCIDDNANSKIGLSIVEDDKIYIDETDKLSARSYMSLIITPKITKAQEKIIVDNFNTYLTDMREKYNSLFLTNYRESNDIARKRISFSLVNEIINNLLSKLDNYQ